MANLAASAVTLVDSWYSQGINGKKFKAKKLTLVLTGQGTATNKILASVLGLTSIVEAGPAITSDNASVIVASPSYDGTMLLLKAAGTNAPADFTATVDVIVKGN